MKQTCTTGIQEQAQLNGRGDPLRIVQTTEISL